MPNQEILKLCLEKGFIIDKELFESLSQIDISIAKMIIEKIKQTSNERFITKTTLFNKIQGGDNIVTSFDNENKKVVERLFINLGLNIEIKKEKILEKEPKKEEEEKQDSASFRIINSYDVPTKKFKVNDFARHFRNRFLEMKKILQERTELQNLVSINKISGNKQNFSIIGAVLNKRTTKNKNILLEMEDLTGRISVLVNHDKKEAYEKAKEILLDDIIAVKGSGSSEIIFVNDIIYPDIHLSERKKSKKEEYALFTSDLHVGSLRFLEDNFIKFTEWLNGKISNKEEASKIKYLFITGDCVDGVGVYPGQEELLKIKDIKKQYEKLAELLGRIRKDINIILCPGQHDAVRVAEPQPAIDKTYAQPICDLENVHLVSNPAVIEIGDAKINVLMYHGASFHSFISDIEALRVGKAHETPAKVVKHMLKRRHLAPTHSSVVYVPNESEDPLFIKKAPDIITTGELHRPDIDIYNNILIICSSCWQSTTPFEEKIGNNPLPCKVPMLNLKTGAIKILDFSDKEEK